MNDREYAEKIIASPFEPHWDDVDDLARRLLSALDREEKLREALRKAVHQDMDEFTSCTDAEVDAEVERRLSASIDEPHGNFSDTQDSNPESGC